MDALSPFQSQTSKNTAHICCICVQKGLRRIPVPKGEKGFTFAHIRASFSEMADLPSSRKNAGPCQGRKGIFKFSDICIVLIQDYPQKTHLYPEASEAGNLDIRVAGQVGASDIVRTL